VTPFNAMGFAGNPLDRLSEMRDDAAALTALRASSGARAAVFVGAMPALRPTSDGFAALHALDDVPPGAEELVLLGRDQTGPVYGLLLADSALVPAPDSAKDSFVDLRAPEIAGRSDLRVRDLRALAIENMLSHEETAILAQAKAVLHWHASHRFCPRCGAPTALAQAGWRRDCEKCGAQHFPRTDPVVIVLATHGDSCLMGRQKPFPPGMYSCLAGFVECGETIEEAARREIFEEAGVRLGAVEVLASQPWPFPSSLMIGVRAEALSRDIVIDKTELEDCRWFSRQEVAAMMAGAHEDALQAPHPIAIARRLLEHWLGA